MTAAMFVSLWRVFWEVETTRHPRVDGCTGRMKSWWIYSQHIFSTTLTYLYCYIDTANIVTCILTILLRILYSTYHLKYCTYIVAVDVQKREMNTSTPKVESTKAQAAAWQEALQAFHVMKAGKTAKACAKLVPWACSSAYKNDWLMINAMDCDLLLLWWWWWPSSSLSSSSSSLLFCDCIVRSWKVVLHSTLQ